MTDERLAEIKAIFDDRYYKRVHPEPWLGNVVRELLGALDALETNLKACRERLAEVSAERDGLKVLLKHGCEQCPTDQLADAVAALEAIAKQPDIHPLATWAHQQARETLARIGATTNGSRE